MQPSIDAALAERAVLVGAEVAHGGQAIAVAEDRHRFGVGQIGRRWPVPSSIVGDRAGDDPARIGVRQRDGAVVAACRERAAATCSAHERQPRRASRPPPAAGCAILQRAEGEMQHDGQRRPTYSDMCSAFHTGGVRKRSQKSWLVAASSSRMRRPAMPNGTNGKPCRRPKLVSAPSSASNGGIVL